MIVCTHCMEWATSLQDMSSPRSPLAFCFFIHRCSHQNPSTHPPLPHPLPPTPRTHLPLPTLTHTWKKWTELALPYKAFYFVVLCACVIALPYKAFYFCGIVCMCNSVSAIPRDVSNSRGFKPVECIGPLRDPVRMPLLRTWSLSFQILEASQMQVLFF